MAAVAAVFRTIPNGGAAIFQTNIYWGTSKWVQDFCARREITLHLVDTADPAALRALCEEVSAQVLFIETPSNPWLKVTDITHASDCAQLAGAKLVVDGTACPPMLTQALSFGADIVLHSVTKVFNGHSDVLGGVLATREKDALWDCDRNRSARRWGRDGPL